MLTWRDRPSLWYTLGPATIDYIGQSLQSGADGIRYTLSYATPSVHIERAKAAARIGSLLGLRVHAIADLPGEKFRLGSFPGETIEVLAGDHIAIGVMNTGDVMGRPPVLPLQDGGILSAVSPGAHIVVGDGAVELGVIRPVVDGIVLCEVVRGGTIENNRGLTLLGGSREPRALTGSDFLMLDQVISTDVFDAVAVSFASDPADLQAVRERIRAAGRSMTIVAKIETWRGVDQVDEMSRVADVVMAARGDLALAVGPHLLFSAVSQIADSANRAGRPWVLATQLLEGLDCLGYPTRAELTDTIGWLEHGAAGAMLSRETVFGSQALPAIKTLRSLLDAPRKWEVP